MTRWRTDGKEADSLATQGTGIDPSDLDRDPTLAKFAPLVVAYRIPTAWATRIERQSSVRLTRTYEFNLEHARPQVASRIRQELGKATALQVTWKAPIDEALSNETSGFGIQRSDREKNVTLDKLYASPTLRNERLVTWSLVQSAALGPEEDFCLAKRTYKFDLPGVATRIRKDLIKSFKTMPRKVGDNPSAVAQIVKLVGEVERFLSTCQDIRVIRPTDTEIAFQRPDVLLEDESELLALAPRLMIEGQPGLGKTTLLRRLAIGLLKRNEPVFYIPCAQVCINDQKRTLTQIAARLAASGNPRLWKPEDSLLLVDGLDEAPFDMTDCIVKSHGTVIVSVRRAFDTSLRAQFARIELSPFTSSDRRSFFARWFSRDPSQRLRAEELISQHAVSRCPHKSAVASDACRRTD